MPERLVCCCGFGGGLLSVCVCFWYCERGAEAGGGAGAGAGAGRREGRRVKMKAGR